MRLLGPHLLASAFLLTTGAPPSLAQTPKSLLETDHLAPSFHLVLRLHAGSYQMRSSIEGRLHVSETRDGHPTPNRSTDVRFRNTGDGARLEIDPPTGKNGPLITVALPPCAALDLQLTAGELVFDTVPCEATQARLHTGEIRATLSDPRLYHVIAASVTIGEVDARASAAPKTTNSTAASSAPFNAPERAPALSPPTSALDRSPLESRIPERLAPLCRPADMWRESRSAQTSSHLPAPAASPPGALSASVRRSPLASAS